MAQSEGEPKLFDQCNVCIVCTDALTLESAEQLAAIIEEYGGEPSIHHSTPTKDDTTSCSHIISNTIDFETYDLACKALIPVVKPSWVHTSLGKRKLANPRQHSPDPRLFLNDVVVTCGDIPEGDKDAIIGGVVAKGGLYSSRMSALVTHLVDLTVTSDKARLAQAKKLRVKIVLPHWFDDCLKLGQRIDERPYILPDPEILRADPDDPVRGFGNKGLNGASTPEPAALPTQHQGAHERNVFDGKCIMLSPDLSIGSRLLESIETVVKRGGATMTSHVTEADWVICRYRDGFVYRTASRLGKEVGNLAWLYSMMTFNEYTRPLSKMLHYPVSPTPIPGFEGLKISLSNYVGEARIYLENLIAAAGGECTKTLKQENTHLITAHGSSEKCTAAREWGLQVVNHLWLEDSYAEWKMQPVSNPRYNHFPSRTNLGDVAGQKMLDKDVLEKHFFPSEDTEHPSPSPPVLQDHHSNVPSMPPPGKKQNIDKKSTETDQGTPKATGKGRKAAEKNAKTPARSRIIPDDKDIETPSSTNSRKSKEAAIAHLHDLAPDIALYEKEKKRVGGVIHGGRRKSDEDRVRENPKKRRSVEPDEENDGEQVNEAKRPKKSRPPISMHLLITGYQRWVGKGNEKKEDADRRQLRDLGIMVIKDARRCTHMAAPSILRTTKFVNALAYAPTIISTDFITGCLEKDELLNPADFTLTDKAAEAKFGFSLAKATTKAKENKNKLLRGFRIYCVEDVRGGFDAFKSIVEANGGECLLFRGRLALTNPSRREESDDEDEEMEDYAPGRHDVFLLSSAESKHSRLWPRFRQVAGDIKRAPKIVRVDWLLDMAMSQELKSPDEYELTEDMVDKDDQ